MHKADLPLHYGSAPKWLFVRMKNLAKEIFRIMHEEYGSKTILERLENPYWFQCLSCVLGFDWHSSGTTTVTIGALKEALVEADIGIKVAGGKGSISRKTPQELNNICKKFDLEAEDYIMLSKAAAKLDSKMAFSFTTILFSWVKMETGSLSSRA